MADLTFDAVICGGGNKALMLAMYLTKYAGMTVGIFERRHEIGGGLATEESSAPGFRGNTHANIMLPWYYAPIWRDFPEFWDYGGQIDEYLVSDGAVFRNNTCLAIYSEKVDPTQERTAREIARFSPKDGERWLNLWKIFQSDEFKRIQMDMIFNPHEWKIAPEYLERQIAILPMAQAAGFDPDGLILSSSPIRAVREWFDSKELQYCIARFVVSSARSVTDAQLGGDTLGMSGTLPTISFARGGTHQIAHACHQILVQQGCKFFTHAEVSKVLIENGKATGIRLADGSTIKARKLVVTAGLSAWQLLDVVGRDVLGPKISRRIDNLSTRNVGNLMWYSFALNGRPRYTAEQFNPDIYECMWLGMAETPDPEHIANECKWASLGMLPPMEEWNPVVGCHSLVDPSFAPPGKHVAQNEMQGPRASDLSEKDWLKLKQKYAEDMIAVWQKYAPNMTWDNVIGIDTNSPFDHVRMKNLAPHGNFAGIDMTLSQLGPNRPTPELANHRVPGVGNLYCTGGFWSLGGEASACQAYTCYKIITKDMNLGKPWEEPGKKEPDSLVEQGRISVKRMRESFPRKVTA
ncbi:MAG: NAD(P)/FAD-dependent oxidoreductase [Chloroflexi bacterium]|nr:NAD(P)/FAD-dependent oxidoreductase [Chloroflexota bacterium]